MRIHTIVLIVLGGVSACASHAPPRPLERFDERTGDTLVSVLEPLVFARDRTDVAAHARDFATLVAIDVDRSGDYKDYLLLYRWSTVDRRMSPPPDPSAGALRILADGRRIDLQPLPELPIDPAQVRHLHLPNHADAVIHAYAVDTTTLRYIAASHSLSVRMPNEALDTPFALFEDGRAALAEFAQHGAP